MGKVTVFGSLVVDMMARGPHLPTPGETVKGTSFTMSPGGKGFNQGVACHKAGAACTMVAKLGRDELAEVPLSLMRDLGMDERYILRSDELPTGVGMVVVDENTGRNQIMIAPGACAQITSEEVDSLEDLVAESDYVLLQLEVNQDANEHIAQIAERHSTKVVLNTAPWASVSDEFLGRVWMVTPNEIEAEGLSGVPVSDLDSARLAADVFRAKGVEVVLITLGSRGVFVSVDGREEIVPAFQVEAVDTTAAGDSFNGGMLAALAEDKDIWEAVRFGQAVAALAVQKSGTAISIPTREEVDAFLAAHQE